jgi:uncharacterized protein YkwD
MISCLCPQCGKQISAADGLSGRVVKCPFCAQPMAVPNLSPPAPTPGPRPGTNFYTLLSLLLGISALPGAILLARPILGLPLAALGLGLGLLGLIVAVQRRGAGLGLAGLAVAWGASSCFTALTLAGGLDGLTRTIQEHLGQRPSAPQAAEPAVLAADSGKEAGSAEKPHKPTKPPSHAEPSAVLPPPSEPPRPAPSAEPSAEPPRGNLVDQAVKKLNAYRRKAALEPVRLNAGRSRGCEAHAQYLLRNYDITTRPKIDMHDEDPGLPGFSAAGQKSARAAVVAFSYGAPNDPDRALDLWMASLFHRLPLLDPTLETIGFGYARGPNYLCFSVMELHAQGKSERIVLYPADQQKDVPLAFSGPEFPDPIPESKDKKAGYPVTAQFPEGATVQTRTVHLKVQETGQEVEGWLSTPEKPAVSAYQRNTICLIPRAPLAPRTAYVATIKAVVDGENWAKTWTFTTGGR